VEPSNGSTYSIYAHPASELESLLKQIRIQKMTGSLTIHFTQGTPGGQLEWKERNRTSYRGPIQRLVKKESA